MWIDRPAPAARDSNMPLIVRCTTCHHDGVVPDDLLNDRATEINCRHCGKPLPLRPDEGASKSVGNSPGAIIAFIMGACSLVFAFGGELALRRALGQDSSRLNPNSLILPQILAVAGFFTGAASRGWMGRWGMILSLLGAAVWGTIVFGPRIMG